MKMILDDSNEFGMMLVMLVMIGMMRGEVRKVGRGKNLEKKREMGGYYAKFTSVRAKAH